MKALSLLYRRRAQIARPRAEASASRCRSGPPGGWSDHDAFLEESGLSRRPNGRCWGRATAPPRPARSCRYPLVVKALPSEAEHKTEMGLVKLRVAVAGGGGRAGRRLPPRIGKPEMGVLVQEMVERRGGSGAVLPAQHRFRPGHVDRHRRHRGGAVPRRGAISRCPVSEEQVLAALRKLKLWTLLQGFRGKQAADVEALARAAVRFGDMFLASAQVREFEVNPVMVKKKGDGLAAVDALVTMGPDTSH
jgi:hypothetical protein